MKPWRLSWTLSHLSNPGYIAKHRRELVAPWKFWLGLLLKSLPAAGSFPIELPLKRGGSLTADEFITLYLYKKIFVDGCYDVPMSPAPSTIVDVGANTGLFALRMKQLYPRCKIYGYEPMPANYARLVRNLRLNRLDDVETYMQGIGSTTRIDKLFIHDTDISGHSMFASEAGSRAHIDIQLLGLGDMLDRMNGDCSLLKLDCEGAELQIIQSIDEELAERIDNVVFESRPSLYDVADAVSHLERVGYQVRKFTGRLWARK
jgi:FkbM family methyltransferase